MKAYKSGNTYKVFKETQRTYYNSHTFLPKPYLQAYTVPSGVTSIHVDCVAAKGYTSTKANGGNGGSVQCDLSVTPGQTLYLYVGNAPSTNIPEFYNASDIRTSNADFSVTENRIIVAGGGGNSGRGSNSGDYAPANGGAGGGLVGETGGTTYQSNGGGGGTQSAGGAGGRSSGSYPLQGHDGSKGYGGAGGYNSYSDPYGGCGGAGWYGGGGGSMQSYTTYNNAGGGGGSSYTDSTLCSNVIHTQGYQNGNGYITISGTNVYYEDITTYKAFNV